PTPPASTSAAATSTSQPLDSSQIIPPVITDLTIPFETPPPIPSSSHDVGAFAPPTHAASTSAPPSSADISEILSLMRSMATQQASFAAQPAATSPTSAPPPSGDLSELLSLMRNMVVQQAFLAKQQTSAIQAQKYFQAKVEEKLSDMDKALFSMHHQMAAIKDENKKIKMEVDLAAQAGAVLSTRMEKNMVHLVKVNHDSAAYCRKEVESYTKEALQSHFEKANAFWLQLEKAMAEKMSLLKTEVSKDQAAFMAAMRQHFSKGPTFEAKAPAAPAFYDVQAAAAHAAAAAQAYSVAHGPPHEQGTSTSGKDTQKPREVKPPSLKDPDIEIIEPIYVIPLSSVPSSEPPDPPSSRPPHVPHVFKPVPLSPQFSESPSIFSRRKAKGKKTKGDNSKDLPSEDTESLSERLSRLRKEKGKDKEEPTKKKGTKGKGTKKDPLLDDSMEAAFAFLKAQEQKEGKSVYNKERYLESKKTKPFISRLLHKHHDEMS
ncbi:hypothetical protein U1Q18_039453, partial [Sarracenia purpurea var. burkii]